MSEQIITYILDNGGVWGLLLVFSIFVNIFLFTNPKLFRDKVPPPSLIDLNKKTEKQKNDEMTEILIKINNISEKVEILFQMHNIRDEDGVPIWYLKRSVIENINEIKINTYKLIEYSNKLAEKQTSIVGEYDVFFDNYRDLVKEYHETLRDLVLGLEKLKVEIEKRG